MASILDLLFGQGTPMQTDASGQVVGPAGEGVGGLLGGFGAKLANNSDRLTALGMGMLSGKTQDEGFANAMTGMQRGAVLDRNRQSLQSAQMEKLAQQKARLGLAQKYGIDPNAAAIPGVFDAAVGDRMDPNSGMKQQMLKLQLQKLQRSPTFDEEAKLKWYQALPDDQKPAAASMLGITGANSLEAQVEQRKRAAAGLGMTPDHPAYQSYTLTGKMPREDAQPLTAVDKKEIYKSEDAIPVLDNTIETLDTALKLNRETFTGRGAGVLGTIGTSGLPGSNWFIDPKKAEKTSEFNKIMSMEAIKNMAETLKGATTDRELERFVEILGDPATPPDIRERTIIRMQTLAKRQKEIATSRINDLRGGSYFKPGGGTPGGKTPGAPPSGTSSSGIPWSVQ